MIRYVLAAAALVCLTAGPSFSQSRDCDAKVETAMSQIAKMNATGSKRIALARMVATGYDYCLAGSMLDADKFFSMAASRDK